ncbi:uncharacterized protein IL334_000987 [Kwoniella shivajii]|uniref:FAD/NAD(P)-binding domain-containing protein n=1 Tax=Kwoniella shivajii TaxID=564305 RepID=A0ABZ1CQN6_9TREE|nr:hypothetical protein IL334_000987 [Kwoniella shivajii]
MSLVTMVDLLVIGGGPAGLSAALTFSRLKRSCVLYDSGLYRNAGVAHSHTISGFENADPDDFRSKMRQDLKDYYSDTLEYRKGLITSLKKSDGGFKASDDQGRDVVARKVVLATGLKDHLPDIEGVTEQWGKRIIHCIFCHGTETANLPFAFLFTKSNSYMNARLVDTMLKLWRSLKHTDRYILTDGMDVETEQGRKDAGLEEQYDLIKKLGYKIVSSKITSVKENSEKTSLEIKFDNHDPISVPNMLLFPERFTPSSDAAPLLTEELLGAQLQAWGTIAPPSSGLGASGMPPRMGDDPKTNVRGLFWAGNSGSAAANYTISLAQGQAAGGMAGDQLGEDDLAKL